MPIDSGLEHRGCMTRRAGGNRTILRASVVARLAYTMAVLVSHISVADAWTDTSGHRRSFIAVAGEVKIEVLDWGGSGPTIVLLAGGGNTAHVFDHFAHQFTDRFRVVGLTRRGYGASSHPSSGYDLETLTRDILAVLDQLR